MPNEFEADSDKFNNKPESFGDLADDFIKHPEKYQGVKAPVDIPDKPGVYIDPNKPFLRKLRDGLGGISTRLSGANSAEARLVAVALGALLYGAACSLDAVTVAGRFDSPRVGELASQIKGKESEINVYHAQYIMTLDLQLRLGILKNINEAQVNLSDLNRSYVAERGGTSINLLKSMALPFGVAGTITGEGLIFAYVVHLVRKRTS